MMTPHLVSIMQSVVSFHGVPYEIEVFGFGCVTAEEARLEAARQVAKWNAVPYRCAPGEITHRAHRAVFRRACDFCLVTGTKPGCKRKKCPVCDGAGSVPAEAR